MKTINNQKCFDLSFCLAKTVYKYKTISSDFLYSKCRATVSQKEYDDAISIIKEANFVKENKLGVLSWIGKID